MMVPSELAASLNPESSPSELVYSIGHSNHTFEKFAALLKRHFIEVVIDTRSYPTSKFSPQYNRPVLSAALSGIDIKYSFLGKELGGRPQDGKYYDDEGFVLYSQMAKSTAFLNGIELLINRGIRRYCVAILCSEENPQDCHRRLLIGRVLAERGIIMHHIRGTGNIQPEMEFIPGQTQPNQASLFSGVEEATWKSVRSVLRREARQDSLAH